MLNFRDSLGEYMPLLEVLETRALFRLTRLVAFTIIFVLTAALVIGASMFFKDLFPNDTSHVGYDQIYAELIHTAPAKTHESSEAPGTETQSQDDINLPFVLQPYFTDSANRNILKQHLDLLDSDDRAEFLSNLADVVNSAKNSGTSSDQIIAVINRYFVDKTEKLNLANLDKSARRERQLYVLGSAIALIGMIALASLILVLLAIERNTRNPRESVLENY